MERNNGEDRNFEYTTEEIEEWKRNPKAYLQYRKLLEENLQNVYTLSQRGSALQEGARAAYEQMTKARLSKKPEIADRIIPTFSPLCKLLTADNVNLIDTGISHVTATGITTTDGEHHPVDVLVCATGFDTSYMGRFPIRGRKGVSLTEQWQ